MVAMALGLQQDHHGVR